VVPIGTRVLAKFYDDGTMNQAVVRAVTLQAGALIYQVEFVGYEGDGVQNTRPSDCLPL
jgi:hypothetical protein